MCYGDGCGAMDVEGQACDVHTMEMSGKFGAPSDWVFWLTFAFAFWQLLMVAIEMG